MCVCVCVCYTHTGVCTEVNLPLLFRGSTPSILTQSLRVSHWSGTCLQLSFKLYHSACLCLPQDWNDCKPMPTHLGFSYRFWGLLYQLSHPPLCMAFLALVVCTLLETFLLSHDNSNPDDQISIGWVRKQGVRGRHIEGEGWRKDK